MKKERWRARDYVVIPRSLLTQNISPSALRLWIALASYCYDSDSCFPSNRAIMERMPEGTALNTVKKAKRELVDQGLIKRERRFDKGRETSSVYILLYPEGTKLVEGNHTVTPREDQTVTHEGNATVTPLNKYIVNKKSEKGKEEIIKRTVDGFVFVEGEGWVEES